jgi:hypothetical protein
MTKALWDCRLVTADCGLRTEMVAVNL